MQKYIYVIVFSILMALLLCSCNEKQLQDNSAANSQDISKPSSSAIEKSESSAAVEDSTSTNTESEDNDAEPYFPPPAPEISDFDPQKYTLTDIKHLQSDEDMFFVISPQKWLTSENEKFANGKQGALYYVNDEQAGILLDDIFEISGMNSDGLYLIQRSGDYKFRLIHFNPITKETKEIKDGVYGAVVTDAETIYLAMYSMEKPMEETLPQIEKLDLSTGEVIPIMNADLTMGPFDGFCVDISFSLKDSVLSTNFMYLEMEFARYFRRVEIDINNNQIIADSEQKAIRASDKYNLYQGNFEPVNDPINEAFWIAANGDRISKDTHGFLPENVGYCSNLNYKDGLYYYLYSEMEDIYYTKAYVFDGKKSEQVQLYNLEGNKIIGDQPRISWGNIFEYQSELYLIGQPFAEPSLTKLALYRLTGTNENPAETQLVLMIRDTRDVAGGFGPFNYARAGAYIVIETHYPYHIVIYNLKSGDTVTLFDNELDLYEPVYK